MAYTYRKVLDSIIIRNINSGQFPDVSIELVRTESGKRMFEAWRVKRENPDDGEGIAESPEFNPQKTYFFRIPGVSLPGLHPTIFISGMGKRSNLCDKILVARE